MKVQLGKPWQETLLEVLPMRKGAKPKESSIVDKSKDAEESESDAPKELEATHRQTEETNNNGTGSEATS